LYFFITKNFLSYPKLGKTPRGLAMEKGQNKEMKRGDPDLLWLYPNFNI